MADEKMIITIGREHGTMGEKVADKLRKQFDLPLYDKAHLLRAVEGTNDYDELNAFFNDRKVNSLLYKKSCRRYWRDRDGQLWKLFIQKSSKYNQNFSACG